MDYKASVEVAGKIAGKQVFAGVMLGNAGAVDPDLTIAVGFLHVAFPEHDEEVIENDILWCQEAEFERLMREQKTWTE